MKKTIELKTETTPTRQLMPDKFTRRIAEMSGSNNISAISTAVNLENMKSPFWEYIEELALETDSRAFRARKTYLEQRDALKANRRFAA